MNSLPYKDPGEKFPIAFTYDEELGSDTIMSAMVTIEVWSGTDATPSTMLAGVYSIVGAQVLQTIQGGLANVTYELTCLATLSSGRILARAARLPVVNAKNW